MPVIQSQSSKGGIMRDYVADLITKSKVFADMVNEKADQISWHKAQLALDYIELAFIAVERRNSERRS